MACEFYILWNQTILGGFLLVEITRCLTPVRVSQAALPVALSLIRYMVDTRFARSCRGLRVAEDRPDRAIYAKM